MTRRKDNKKKRGEKRIDFLGHSVISESDIAIEKGKARKLRNSSWWSRKRSTGRCNYCRKIFPPDELTMDHIIPLSRGGTSEKFNLVPACKECNSKKRYLLPAEWEEHLQMIQNSTIEQE